jgi:hypothetical protein
MIALNNFRSDESAYFSVACSNVIAFSDLKNQESFDLSSPSYVGLKFGSQNVVNDSSVSRDVDSCVLCGLSTAAL